MSTTDWKGCEVVATLNDQKCIKGVVVNVNSVNKQITIIENGDFSNSETTFRGSDLKNIKVVSLPKSQSQLNSREFSACIPNVHAKKYYNDIPEPGRAIHHLSERDRECFSHSNANDMEEFDFVASNLQFDKEATFRKFEQNLQISHRQSEMPHHNSEEFLHHYIYSLPKNIFSNNRFQCLNKNYSIGSISNDGFQQLLAVGEDMGLSCERRHEIVGNLVSAHIMEVLSTMNRNCKTVVFLCGSHKMGAHGMAIARYLVQLTDLNIMVFLSKKNDLSHEVQKELTVFHASNIKRLKAIEELPSSCDLIIDCLDSPGDEWFESIDTYQRAVEWMKKFRCPIIAVHPNEHYSRLVNHIIAIGFPFAWSLNRHTHVFLANIFYPKILSHIGVMLNRECSKLPPFIELIL